MIESLRDANQYLYHYTTLATAQQYIIKNGTLRLSSYTRTNDPKESKAWEFSLGSNENRDLFSYSVSEESDQLSKRLKAQTKLICFSMDRGPLTGNHLEDIFRRGFARPRMWAQYGDRHKGVCLVFDRQRISNLVDEQIAANSLVLCGPVSYVDRPPFYDLYAEQQYMINMNSLEKLGRDEYAKCHAQTHYQKLFFEKMTDWRDEYEWRWVVFSETEDDLYLNYGQSLVGVVFGADCDPASSEALVNQVQGQSLQSIQFMGIRWKNCSPWYDYGNPLYS